MNSLITRGMASRRDLRLGCAVFSAFLVGCASSPSESDVRASIVASSRAVECINTRAKQIRQGQLKVENSAQIIRLCTDEITTADAYRVSIGLNPYPYERWQMVLIEALRSENAAKRSQPSVNTRSKEEYELVAAYNSLRASLVIKRIAHERCKQSPEYDARQALLNQLANETEQLILATRKFVSLGRIGLSAQSKELLADFELEISNELIARIKEIFSGDKLAESCRKTLNLLNQTSLREFLQALDALNEKTLSPEQLTELKKIRDQARKILSSFGSA